MESGTISSEMLRKQITIETLPFSTIFILSLFGSKQGVFDYLPRLLHVVDHEDGNPAGVEQQHRHDVHERVPLDLPAADAAAGVGLGGRVAQQAAHELIGNENIVYSLFIHTQALDSRAGRR